MANSTGYNSYIKILKKIVKDYDKNVKDNTCLMKETFLLTLAKVGSLVDPEDSNGKKVLSPDERNLLERIQTILQKEAEKWNQLFLEDIQNFKSFISDQLNANQNEMVALIHKLPADILENDLIVRLKDHLAGNLPTAHIVDFISPLTQSDKAFHEMHQNLKKINEELFKIDQTNGCVLKNILLDIQYFWTSHFNNEAVMMFLYADMDKEPFTSSDCSAVRTVVKKHQQLFQDMYDKLKTDCPTINILLDMEIKVPSAIQNKIVSQPQNLYYKQPFHPQLIYLHLKKLFALYRDFYKENGKQNSSIPSSLLKYMNRLEKILLESQLMMPVYVEANHLIKDITKALAIQQTDLAQLLGVSKQTVNKSSGQSELFKSMMSISLTFLCGKTTVPYYGKNIGNNNCYVIPPVYFRLYATFIIDSIASFKTYERKMENSNQVIKINCSADFAEELSRKALRISSTLKPFQYEYDKICKQSDELKKTIDSLGNQQKVYEKNLEDERMKLEGQPANKDKEVATEQSLERIQSNLEKAENNFEKITACKEECRRKFLDKMDACIMLLEEENNSISSKGFRILNLLQQHQDKMDKSEKTSVEHSNKIKKAENDLNKAKTEMEKTIAKNILEKLQKKDNERRSNGIRKQHNLEKQLDEFISILEAF